MTPILIAGPALEPVSLAEMKAWLRVDGTDEDDLVSALITAARLMVEAASKRLLITQEWRLVLDAWPVERILRVPLGPLLSVDAVRVFDANGIATDVAASSYQADVQGDPGRVLFIGPLPPPGRCLHGIEIDTTAGFGPAAADVPQPLRQAIRLLAARWFENRGDGPELDGTALPHSVTVLLAPYRQARLR